MICYTQRGHKRLAYKPCLVEILSLLIPAAIGDPWSIPSSLVHAVIAAWRPVEGDG